MCPRKLTRAHLIMPTWSQKRWRKEGGKQRWIGVDSQGNLDATHRFERCSEKPPWRVRERRKISVKADDKKSSFCSAKTMERRGAWRQSGEQGTQNGTGRYQQSISIPTAAAAAAAAFHPAVARTLVQKVRPPADAPHARQGVGSGEWGSRHYVLPDCVPLHWF